MRVCTTPVAVYIDSVKACEYRYVDRVVPDTEWEERVCAAYFFFIFYFFLSRVRLQPRTHVHDMPLMCLYMTTYLYMHIY